MAKRRPTQLHLRLIHWVVYFENVSLWKVRTIQIFLHGRFRKNKILWKFWHVFGHNFYNFPDISITPTNGTSTLQDLSDNMPKYLHQSKSLWHIFLSAYLQIHPNSDIFGINIVFLHMIHQLFEKPAQKFYSIPKFGLYKNWFCKFAKSDHVNLQIPLTKHNSLLSGSGR